MCFVINFEFDIDLLVGYGERYVSLKLVGLGGFVLGEMDMFVCILKGYQRGIFMEKNLMYNNCIVIEILLLVLQISIDIRCGQGVGVKGDSLFNDGCQRIFWFGCIYV